MKYRRLDNSELQDLEPQFIRFLASNTVTADDWTKLKSEDLEKAEKLIEMFSDIVFQQTLEKVEFLERRTPVELQIFSCEPEQIKLRGLRILGETSIDFTLNEGPEEMIKKLKQSDAELQIYRAQKKYNKLREQELFEMLEQGCRITQGDLYQTLDQLKGDG